MNHKGVFNICKQAYNAPKKLAVLILGAPGIGKSQEQVQLSRWIAETTGREMLEWNRIDEEIKTKFYTDAAFRKKTHLFVDLRISQLDPSDLRGLPKLNGEDYTKWMPTLLFRILSLQETQAHLFFDEINLAPPAVQASAYQIILDRCIGEISLAPGVFITAAGNRAEDRANVFEMALPLKNRFTHCQQDAPTVKEWTEWALQNDIDTRIVGFLNFKETALCDKLDDVKKTKTNAFATPRSWEFASHMVRGITDPDDAGTFVSTAVGDAHGVEFRAFVLAETQIKPREILEDPDKFKKIKEISHYWVVISCFAEFFRQDKKTFPKILEVVDRMSDDYAVAQLRFLIQIAGASAFQKSLLAASNRSKVSKYMKYFELMKED